jgi:hypothetical protein
MAVRLPSDELRACLSTLRFGTVPIAVIAFAVLALTALGCGSSQGSPFDSEDSGASIDAPAPPQTDAGSGEDGGAAPDANMMGDAGIVPPTDAGAGDAAVTDSAVADSAVVDAGSAPDATVAITGLSWPPGQAFPTFAPLGTLDVVDTTSLDAGVITVATTLEGLVNRTQPRIYLAAGAGDIWLPKLDASTNSVADPMTLVTKYASEISGIVIYDETLMDTLNLATTIAGVEGGIVSPPSLRRPSRRHPTHFQ